MIKKRIWRITEAEAYVSLVDCGIIPMGLKYCSALDFLRYNRCL